MTGGGGLEGERGSQRGDFYKAILISENYLTLKMRTLGGVGLLYQTDEGQIRGHLESISYQV